MRLPRVTRKMRERTKLPKNRLDDLKLLAGLGNPGGVYRGTRHNIGFMVLDELSSRWGVKIEKVRFRSLTGESRLAGEKIICIKPQTFMNLSGEALQQAASYYSVDVQDIIIVHDDKDLPFGRMKIAQSGSDGGHKGIRSAIRLLKSNDFIRIRMGIGQPEHSEEVADYVLSAFYSEQLKNLNKWIDKGADAVELSIRENADKAANVFNGRCWIQPENSA